MAKTIGAKPLPECYNSTCEWDVRMDNSELPEWWRGHGETLVVAFDTKDSVIVRKNLGYGVGVKADLSSPSSIGVIEQQDWGRRGIPVPIAKGWRTTELFRYYEVTVWITPAVSAQDRRRYTSFNFNCFWR